MRGHDRGCNSDRPARRSLPVPVGQRHRSRRSGDGRAAQQRVSSVGRRAGRRCSSPRCRRRPPPVAMPPPASFAAVPSACRRNARQLPRAGAGPRLLAPCSKSPRRSTRERGARQHGQDQGRVFIVRLDARSPRMPSSPGPFRCTRAVNLHSQPPRASGRCSWLRAAACSPGSPG